MRWTRGGALALWLGVICPLYGQAPDDSSWLIASLSDSFPAAAGATLRLRHLGGDVRIEAADTDRVQVTAVAQSHRDDPRKPSIRFVPSEGDLGEGGHRLIIEFAQLEVAAAGAWSKRRIDVGLLVPAGIRIEIETDRGLIEAKKLTSAARLVSDRGEIVYDGSGDLTARTERGSMRVLLRKTGQGRFADLSTLTGDIWCILLEGAGADVTLETRGPVTTDYTVEIDRAPGSPLKKVRIRVGAGGSKLTLQSHSGGIRLQSLIVPEAAPTGS